VGTEQALAVWNGARFQIRTPTNGEPTVSVQHLLFGPDGEMWVLGNNQLRRAVAQQWVTVADEIRGTFSNWETRLGVHEDWRGRVWLYHYGRGLYLVGSDGRTKHFSVRDGLPNQRVDCYLEDREGNIWVGVDRGGLIRLREKHFSVLAPEEPTEARTAVTVSEDNAGGIWVGTFGEGLHRLINGRWENYFEPSGAQRGFVFSAVADQAGRVWASAGEEDLFVKSDGDFAQFNPLVHGVKCILPARDGKVWLGTKTGLGVVESGEFRLFWGTEGVPRLDIRCLAEDAQGAIWAGAGNGVLYRVRDMRGDGFTPPGSRTGQPIWSVLTETNGTVWAGTFRGGLLRFADGAFTRVTTEQGLPDAVICQLLDDGQGNLWMGSQRGIFRVAKTEVEALAAGRQKTVTSVSYGRHDGLPSLECSEKYQPAAWCTKDGRLLFSTLKGVVMVQSEGYAPRRLAPTIGLEGISVDGNYTAWEHDQAGEEVRLLEIPAGTRLVRFHFGGVSLVSPDSTRFRYRLEGLNEDWSDVGARREADLIFPPTGKYNFLVQACSSDGVWSPAASATIYVNPHLYETWWFISLMTAAAVLTVAGIVRTIALRRMRRELERLERQRAVERDRARIAKDIHDDLGAGLTHIALLSEMAKPAAGEDTQAQLSQITEVARELTTNMDEIVWAIDPQNDSLEALITYVSKFTQDYLGAAQIRCRLDVPAQLPEHQLQSEVRHNLFLAVKEALNNVVKHARATEAWLRVRVGVMSFTVTVEDNGRGLAAAAADESSRAGRVSSGLGLKNLEKRLASAGGRCVIESEPGRGTRVQFTVPLGASSPELASSPAAETV
jgi:signal transduction histidine kinase/ligand-binding sensor domain-containing protein